MCLVLDQACSDFLGSKIFGSDRLDLTSGLIFLSLFFLCSHRPQGSALVGFSICLVSSSRSGCDSAFLRPVSFSWLQYFLWRAWIQRESSCSHPIFRASSFLGSVALKDSFSI
jgi:hypothetical protein